MGTITSSCPFSMTNEEHTSQKSEDNLAMAESELDKNTSLVTDLTRKVDELQIKADEAVKLKDRVDECVVPFSLSRSSSLDEI